MNPGEAETLVARLERIERDNRCLRWIGLLLVLCLAILIAAVPGLIGGRSRVRAARFELKDSSGRVRASLGFTKDGAAALQFVDEEGRDQLAMTAREQSSSIDLYQQGHPRMSMLTAVDGSSTLQFLSPGNSVPTAIYTWPDGASGLFLSGQSSPVHLIAGKNGPARLSLLNREYQEMGAFQLSPEGTLDWQAIANSSVTNGELRTVTEKTVAVDQAGL